MNRIIFLDIAKAICIVLVVVGHYIPTNSPLWYKTLHDVIYTFHMPLFMFASGYVYIATKRENGYGSFIVKKIKRLMIPYFTTSFIVISIKILTQGSMSVENPVTPWSYLKMLYFPEAGYFLWFIWALWWMFVIISFFKTQKSRFLFFILCLILHYIPCDLPEIFCIAQCKSMIVFFMLGIFAYENIWANKFITKFRISQTVITTFIFIVGEYIYFSIHTPVNNFIGFILPYLGILFCLEISKLICQYKTITSNNLLMVIAASSYIIYLFHTTFEGFVKAIFSKIPLNDTAGYIFVIQAITVILSGIIFPVLLHKQILNRWKILKLLFGLK